MPSLRESLTYTPVELRFGTSGRRGEVVHLSQLEIYTCALAEVRYLQSLPAEEGGIRVGEDFYFATDLRPSSSRFVAEQGGRGELAQAVERAILDGGMHPVYLGQLPTPALTSFALSRGKGSMMVTGSHIPFDRNGYKTNTSLGELLKHHEAPINACVASVREELLSTPFEASQFDANGCFKSGARRLPPAIPDAREAYIRRYTEFFPGALAGLRLLFYQHSAVGRDLVPEILRGLGAEVVECGRSETFVPIDTENIDAEQLATIQALLDAEPGHVDAIVSTDGDSDRPLILGVEETGRRAKFFSGDLVGMVVAEYLGADAVVVPISANDAIDRGPLAAFLEPKTRIGSPFVIAGMEAARASGHRRVCGWEANGGFLTGSEIERGGRRLAALPTRDAVLPIVCTLASAREHGLSLPQLFAQLPARFSKSVLIREFPRAVALRIMQRFTPVEGLSAEAIAGDLAGFFPAAEGFGCIARLDYTDGVRVIFDNGEVAHFRPSGNAAEMRFYTFADTQARADLLAAAGIAEPAGVLRRMERSVG